VRVTTVIRLSLTFAQSLFSILLFVGLSNWQSSRCVIRLAGIHYSFLTISRPSSDEFPLEVT